MLWHLLSESENARLNRCPRLYTGAGGASPDSTEGSGHGGCYAVFSFVILVKTGERGSNRSFPLSRGGQGPLHTRTQSRNQA